MTPEIDRIAATYSQRDKTQRGYKILCPLHDDKKPSLHVWDEDGSTRLYCHAGCATNLVRTHFIERGLLIPKGGEMAQESVQRT